MGLFHAAPPGLVLKEDAGCYKHVAPNGAATGKGVRINRRTNPVRGGMVVDRAVRAVWASEYSKDGAMRTSRPTTWGNVHLHYHFIP